MTSRCRLQQSSFKTIPADDFTQFVFVRESGLHFYKATELSTEEISIVLVTLKNEKATGYNNIFPEYLMTLGRDNQASSLVSDSLHS